MGMRDLFGDAVNAAVTVGRGALEKFYAPESADTAKVSKMAARRTVAPTNPLTKTSAFRTMGQSTKPTFGGFAKTVGGSTVDGLSLVNSGLSLAQGDYEASPARIFADVASAARLAGLNKNLAAKGGAPLKAIRDPRSTMIAYGLQETVPRLYDQVTNKEINHATYNQNVANALISHGPNRVEKFLGLPGYNPSQSWKNSVAAGAPVSPNYFGANPPSDSPRKPMQGRYRYLGEGAMSRPAVYGQLGEIFDFAKKRGIEPAREYMDHIIRRDGLNQQQASELQNAFYGKLYDQKSFRK
jgi:hypothetical protein